MKKTLLSMMGVAVTVLAFGQSTNINGYSKAIAKDVNAVKTVATTPVISTTRAEGAGNGAEALGAIIFTETFGAGLAGDGTNGAWTTNGVVSGVADADAVWEYRGTATTPSNATGSQGAYAGSAGAAGGAPIMSATTANGFFIFDSDYLDNAGVAGAFGTGDAPTPHESWLVSPIFSTSGYMDISINLNAYFRRFRGDGYILLSNDGGATWGDSIALFDTDFGVNEASAIDEVINTKINFIANAASAQIAFYFDGETNGDGYYFFMVDDIIIAETPDNNLSLENTFYRTNADTGATQYYSRVPGMLATFDVIDFSGTMTNRGTVLQENTKYTTEITTPTGTSTINSNMVNLMPGSSDSLAGTASFSFTDGMGLYSWSHSVSSDSTDDVPSNNVSDTVFVQVTDSTYSRDRGASGNLWFGAGNTYEIGWIYDIYDTVKATSITFAVGANTPENEAISVYIYNANTFDPAVPVYLVATEFYSLTAADIGVLKTLAIPETVLAPGAYIVTFKGYSDAVTFPNSNFEPYSGSAVSNVNDGGFSLTNAAPVVRLNVTADLVVCDVVAAAVQAGNNTATVTATGGTLPYSYSWDNGETTATATNLSSGVNHTVTVTDANGCTGTTAVDIVSSVRNIELNNNVTLYPNPNNGEFTLSLNGLNGVYTVSVKNLLGQTISVETISVSGSMNKTINNANLNKGVYFVEVSDTNGANAVIRFVVE